MSEREYREISDAPCPYEGSPCMHSGYDDDGNGYCPTCGKKYRRITLKEYEERVERIALMKKAKKINARHRDAWREAAETAGASWSNAGPASVRPTRLSTQS